MQPAQHDSSSVQDRAHVQLARRIEMRECRTPRWSAGFKYTSRELAQTAAERFASLGVRLARVTGHMGGRHVSVAFEPIDVGHLAKDRTP